MSEQLSLLPRHHCDACAAFVAEAVEAMRLARERGEYDAEGYTPTERKAQQRRRAAQ